MTDNMKPVVLLSHKYSDQHWGLGRSYKVESNYCRALIGAGALPLMTCGGEPEEMAGLADGVLFTGGCDIEPQRYGEGNQFEIKPDFELDEMELAVFKAFFNAGKPIFGICRGIQLVNVAMGGTLYQDLPRQVTLGAHKPSFESGIDRHRLRATPGGFAERLFGREFETNSFHHQAVKVLGRGMKAAAVTDEGVVEAIEHETRPIMAVQWHPERMIGEENVDLPDMTPLFGYFADLCRKARANRR